jgi:signal transduction histidine kinase
MEEIIETTKQKLSLEKRLRHANKMESIGTMASGIAHNFNNILAAVIGYADMLREEISKNSTGYIYNEKVLKSAHRAQELVKQIMTFSQHKESSSELIQPDLMLHDILDSIKDSIPKNIIVDENISSNCGKLNIDHFQFKKIVTNISMNSLYAMRDTKGVLGISLDVTTLKSEDMLGELTIKPGNYIKLTIRDTGQGITTENIDRIFDPFFTTKGIGEGDGIGLSVVHGIVRKSGGMIKVESVQGEGSEFYVFLPVAKPILDA